jgi:hypothetical protein
MKEVSMDKLVRAREILFAARYKPFQDLLDIENKLFNQPLTFALHQPFLTKLSQYYALNDTSKLVQLLDKAR